MKGRNESMERRVGETRDMMATPLDEILHHVRYRVVTDGDGITWATAKYRHWTARAKVHGDGDYWREGALERARERLVVRMAESAAALMRRCERPRLDALRRRQHQHQ